MALPLIFVPAGLPLWLVAGHGVTPQSPFEDTPMKVGHGRKRRIYTTVPRIANVSTFLSREQALAWDTWFEDILHAGAEKFTAEIASTSGAGRKFWAVEWLDPPNIEPLVLGRFVVTGQLLLTGEPSDVRPSTGVLALELEIELGGLSTASFPINLAQELEIELGAITALSQTITVELDVETPLELRDDAGLELRDDGGLELKDD
jgi:hypothetical protein